MVFKFFGMIITKGFKQSTTNNSLFVKNNGNSFMALLVYVDDIILASNNQNEVDDLKKFLNECFKLKYFLGLEVARSSKGIYLSEIRYALQLLSNSNLDANQAKHQWILTPRDLQILIGPLVQAIENLLVVFVFSLGIFWFYGNQRNNK